MPMSNEKTIRSVVIAGGQAAGWTAAAALSQGLQGQDVTVTVVESATADPGPPAESTLANTPVFHARHGMDERDLMRGTRAVFRLGTAFSGWWKEDYFQPLGRHGAGIGFLQFQHYYSKALAQGDETPFNAYSLGAQAARLGHFAHPDPDPNSVLSTLAYGLHLDTAWYGLYLRGFSEYHGAKAIEGDIAGIERDPNSGFITSLVLADGRKVAGDLFIDCSGIDARLIGAGLGIARQDWSRDFPVNSVLTLNLPPQQNPEPFTSLRAIEQGWLRSIPLQDRVVCELAYHSDLLADTEAEQLLRTLAPTAGAKPPRLRSVSCGALAEPWSGNCIALGDAACSLEPLAVGSLHLVETGTLRLLELFPDRDCNPLMSFEFNRLSLAEFENARDFNLAHYQGDTFAGEAFWERARSAKRSERLENRLRLFASQGELPYYDEETFGVAQWVSLLFGQGRRPAAWNRSLDAIDFERLKQRFDGFKATMAETAAALPSHRDYLLQYLRTS